MVDKRPRVEATPRAGVSRAATAAIASAGSGAAAAAAAALITLAIVATSTPSANAYVIAPPADAPHPSSAWRRNTRPAATTPKSSLFKPQAAATASTMFSHNPAATDASESERRGANVRDTVGGERGRRRKFGSRRGRPLWASPKSDGGLDGLEGDRGVEGGDKDKGDPDAEVRRDESVRNNFFNVSSTPPQVLVGGPCERPLAWQSTC